MQLPKPENETSPVAMTTSDVRKELVDKEWAYIIDVTLNPAIYGDEASLNQLKKRALVELVFRYIESKCSLTLSRQFDFCEGDYVGNRDNLLNFICPSALTNKLQRTLEGNDTNLTLDRIRDLSKDNTMKENNCLPTTNKNNKQPSRDKIQPITTNHINNNYSDAMNSLKEVKTNRKIEPKVSSLPTPNVEINVNRKDGKVELRIELPNVESVSECDLELTEVSWCETLLVPRGRGTTKAFNL